MLAKHLSVEEFSQISGYSTTTVWRYLRAGKIPFFQPGGKGHRVSIPEDAVLAVTNSTVPATTVGPTSAAPAKPPLHLSGQRPAWMGEVSL
jgi:hypothetical protein